MTENVRPTDPAPYDKSHPASLPGGRTGADLDAAQPYHEIASRAVVRAVEEVEFPIQRDALIREVGERAIPLGEGKVAPLRQVLDRLPNATYTSPKDVAAAVNYHWEFVERLRENV